MTAKLEDMLCTHVGEISNVTQSSGENGAQKEALSTAGGGLIDGNDERSPEFVPHLPPATDSYVEVMAPQRCFQTGTTNVETANIESIFVYSSSDLLTGDLI